jgi:hypothetical protein
MRALVIAMLCFAQVALAGPHQVLVLRSEGTADTSSRTSVDTHVLRLAKNIDGKVDAGDITFTEAAAVVGCQPSEAACKDEVLTTLGVDEIVATTVTATPTGLNVTVRRIGKNGAPKAAQTTIPAGKSPDAKLNADIGPMFGLTAAPVPEDKVEPKPTATKPPPPTTTKPPPPTTTQQPKPPPPRVATEDRSTAPMNEVTAAPAGVVAPPSEGARPSRRVPKVLMGVGGGFVLLGILMWMSASNVQGQIDDKPEPVSPADFQELRDLEKQGDDIAGGGNLLFLVGAGLAGVGGYYYWKAGKASNAQSARIAPAAFPGGAGVTLTIGGAP